ncbi:stabilin-2-like [Babylonia areolata]|uniref:stabilin-2-like n=1 Tax=Babylonia areolata TaxID=304850 RepID=UPI003FD1E929
MLPGSSAGRVEGTSVLVLVFVVICTCLSQPGRFSAHALQDSVRFCNENATEQVVLECTWPCFLVNSSSCPEGTEFESSQPCEVPSWKRALYARSLNVSEGVGEDEDEEGADNSTASFEEEDFDRLENATACQAVCSRVIQIPRCCPGFFGSHCLECPRSVWSENLICSGHGVCDDGIDGHGVCLCEDGFTGMTCGLCEDTKKFGSNCTEDCMCVNGYCDNGPTGSGACRLCFAGFEGPLCDQEIMTCDNLTCAANSRCEEPSGQPECVCDPGYEGQPSNVTACTPVNVCENDADRVCGERVCVYDGPGRFKCRCPDGHRDDGVRCHPINPCDFRNGGCDLQSTMCMHTGANTSTCDCLTHYENYVEGEGCSLVDVCPTADCHRNANCSTTGPNQYRCTCLPGYVGDGKENCFGNIMESLQELNANHRYLRNQLTMALALLDGILNKALTERGPFTIFVPNNRAFRKARRVFPFASMVKMPERSREVIRQHMLAGSLTLEDLQKYDSFYTLQGNLAELQVRVAKGVFKYRVRGHASKAKVVSRDNPAFNGMIHVVNELLINEANIEGDTSKSAMTLIREEGRFNRMQTLIRSLDLEAAFERPNITVFAPENGGLDDLPEGTLDYLMTEEEGKAKLRTLLENHIFPGRIPITDLVSLQRIRSVANYSFDVSVGDRGRVQLNGKVNISQADIPCRNAVYYHIDGPLIPDHLADILPSRCDAVTNSTVQGRCQPCNAELKCPRESDIFSGEVTEGCQYWGWLDGRYTAVSGCKPRCTRTTTIRKCCPGFYGRECLPCPGGHKNPCGGHGECSDQMFGTGFCICDTHFRGERCDKCLDRNKFGPNCTDECSCLHGECDGGPAGKGLCRPGTCYADFEGDRCDLELKVCGGHVPLRCHLHATCVRSRSNFRCVCQTGYEGDGRVCQEVDPCQKADRGRCHSQASCTKVGPGANHCQCEEGWYGDGFTCSPVIACNTSDHCHPNASCIDLRPGLFTCKCDEGYEGNGTDCTEVNACLQDNGGCHELASCSSTGPGTVNCTCPENFLGDGTRCFTTIAGHVLTHPNLTLLAQLIQKQAPGDRILGEVGEAFTFFAPSDDALRHFLEERVPSGYFDDEENVMSFFQFHTLGQDYTLQEMLALEGLGSFGRWETLFDGYSVRVFIKNKTVNVLSSQITSASVVSGDIAGLNGHLHIIDGVLEPFLPDSEQPFLREFFQLHGQFSLFGEWLQRKGLIEELQSMDHYTLFVPDNSVFNSRDVKRTITADFLKYYILPSIVLTPAVDDNQTVSTLLGDTHQLRFNTRGSQVLVNGVPIVTANVLMVEGVVHTISGLLHPALHFCNRTTYKRQFGECSRCTRQNNVTCPEGFESTGPVERHNCLVRRGGRMYLGCRAICQQSISVPQCCSGYYGPNCLECPGGPEEPCGGRGLCDDGQEGQGICLCDRLFSGPVCQHCEDGNMAGPACNISKQSCQYNNGNCSANAQCTDIPAPADDGVHVHCRCRPGYVGDGYKCTSPCDTYNGGCHANATCTLQAESQTVQCTCRTGFHGSGVTCTANVDGCEEGERHHGGCSPFAECRYTPPPVTARHETPVTCRCLDGHVGNGTLCVTTVLDAVAQMSAASAFHLEVLAPLVPDNVSQLLGSDQTAITVFIPVSPVDLSGVNINDYVVLDIVVLTPDVVAESNTSQGAIVASSGLPLSVTLRDGQYYVRGSRVLDRNIPAVNGIINLLETPFKSEEGSTGSSKSPPSGSVELIVILVPVAVVVLMVLVVVGVIICYRRSQATGFLDFVKNIRKGSDASMSFARLKAQESEDDAHSPFSQPDNVNFDNPLYNDPEPL